jgi:hypothetical protein
VAIHPEAKLSGYEAATIVQWTKSERRHVKAATDSRIDRTGVTPIARAIH